MADHGEAQVRAKAARLGESLILESQTGPLAEDDPEAMAEQIAEVLYGLFGADALAGIQGKLEESLAWPTALREAWSALDHPRGKGGRFIPKGSAEAQTAAKEAIGKVLKGDKVYSHSAEDVAKHLAILKVAQLREPPQGRPASPSRASGCADLVEAVKVAAAEEGQVRRRRHRRSQRTSFSAEKVPKPAHKEPPAGKPPVEQALERGEGPRRSTQLRQKATGIHRDELLLSQLLASIARPRQGASEHQ